MRLKKENDSRHYSATTKGMVCVCINPWSHFDGKEEEANSNIGECYIRVATTVKIISYIGSTLPYKTIVCTEFSNGFGIGTIPDQSWDKLKEYAAKGQLKLNVKIEILHDQ